LQNIPSPHEKAGKYTSIGLKNTENRLKLNYGEECRLRIESEEGKYTLISIELPIIC